MNNKTAHKINRHKKTCNAANSHQKTGEPAHIPPPVERIAEYVSDSIVRFDQKLRYTYVNSAFESIVARARSDIEGKTNSGINLPESVCQQWDGNLNIVFETGKPNQFTLEMPQRHGLFDCLAVPEFAAHDTVLSVLCILRDITQQANRLQKKQQVISKQADTIDDQTQQLKNTVQHLRREVREHRRIKRHLEKNQIRLSIANRIAHMGSWEWNIDTHEAWWSDEIYRIFGANPENYDPSYENFLSFVHPDDRPVVEQAIDKALHNGVKYYSIEHKIISSAGERIVIERAEVIRDAARKPVRMIGTLQDVTEERKREERFRQQDRQIRSHAELLDQAHDTIIVHDLDGKITFWNKGAENTYGWKKEEALGRKTHEILKTKFNEPLLQSVMAVSQTGSWEGELVYTTKDGRELIVESRWVLRKDEYGNPAAIMEIDRDITQRKAAEKQIQEARKYAESVIETIQEALVVLDADLRVLSANNTFYTLFGLAPHETENRYIYQLDRKQWDIPELRKLLEDILPQNTAFQGYEMEFIPSEGPAKTLLLNARRIYRDKKKTQMILLAMQDITQLKHQQQEVRDLTEQLLLAEEKQRQQIATALHDSIGQILAFSNRELATLLKNADSQTAQPLEHVKTEISRAIKQSRELTADLSSPTLNTFGLEAGIEELADRFSDTYQIKCRFRSNGHLPPLKKNIELAFYQGAKELLCNIAKHASAGKVRINLHATNNHLQLTVADDGAGFDTSMLDKGAAEKNGFGLFNIRQRLINLGGSFNIESEKKKGTTITLNVPLEEPKGNDYDDKDSVSR